MEKEYITSSLTLLLGIVGSLFAFAAVQKIGGDTIAAASALNGRDIMGAIWIFSISWVAALAILLIALRSIKTSYKLKTPLIIGVVISSIAIPILTVSFPPALLFGSMTFDISDDYLYILRNLTIGAVSILMMWTWGDGNTAPNKK